MSTAEQIAADYQRSVPNTNSLSERLAAAHKRNVEHVQSKNTAPVVGSGRPQHLTAKQYAYESGITLLEPLVLRIEELERKLSFLEECLVNAAAPRV